MPLTGHITKASANSFCKQTHRRAHTDHSDHSILWLQMVLLHHRRQSVLQSLTRLCHDSCCFTSKGDLETEIYIHWIKCKRTVSKKSEKPVSVSDNNTRTSLYYSEKLLLRVWKPARVSKAEKKEVGEVTQLTHRNVTLSSRETCWSLSMEQSWSSDKGCCRDRNSVSERN